MPQDNSEAEQLQAREQAQSGAVEAWRMQNQQRLEELRAYKEVGESELATLHEQAALVKEKIRLRDSIAMQQQHIAAFQALDKINLKDPNTNLDDEIDKIQASNPLVAKDPAWRQAVAHRYTEQSHAEESINKLLSTALDLFREYKTPIVYDNNGVADVEKMRQNILVSQAQAKSQIPPGYKEGEVTIGPNGEATTHMLPPKPAENVDKQKAYTDAITNGTIRMGGVVGKDFVVAGEGTKATHVEVSYLDPETGRPVQDVLPVEQYRALTQKKSATENPPDAAAAQPPAEAHKTVIKLTHDPATGKLVPQ